MYKVDPILRERLRSKLQTRSNNCDPRPQLHITRRTTPISTQRFWEDIRVTPTVGTRSSIAVRRPEGNLTGDMIFVAQVESGNAVIRKAQPRINLTDMVWSHVTTLNNVSELSIMFDGYMKMVEGKVESYTTGDLPVVFYVDSDNSLKGWNMNTDVTFTISDTAYNVASVRGLYSEAADLNDGIFVFYTNASGELWEARVLNDEVTELTQITLKPEGVTGWEDVWASLTFDYRVVLQLKGTDGNIHSLMSYSRTGGFSNIESLRLISGKIESGACGYIPPNFVKAEVVTVNNSTNKTIKLIFDGPVHNVTELDLKNITLSFAYGEIYQTNFKPSAITLGLQNEVLVTFINLSRVLTPIIIKGVNILFGSYNLGVQDFNFEFDPIKFALIPGDYEWLCLSGANIESGSLDIAFDGKVHFADNCSSISSFNINSGALYKLAFKEGYVYENCSAVTGGNILGGVVCDINNIPL